MKHLPAFPWLLTHFALSLALLLPAPPAIAQDRGADRQEEGEGEGMRRFWNRFRRPSIYQRSHDSVKEPFGAVIGNANRSIVRVFVDGEQAVLGTVVAGKGLVLTKASELRDRREMRCELFDGRRLKAEQVGVNEDYDLALLKVPAEDLTAVDWVSTETPVGAWLVTPGTDDMPVSIGVVSAAARGIRKSRALLGVRLANVEQGEAGARVAMVFPNSGADRAGVEVGDVIIGADEETINDRDELIAYVTGLLPGDRVSLRVMRDDEELDLTAELTDEEALSQSRVEVQNSLGGPISRRRSGFPKVIQHDSVLRPEQCGGPVLNLDGKAVGLNIARAGRVASYAVPAADVVRVLPTLVSTIGTFREQERAQRIRDLERKVDKWKQTLGIFEKKLADAKSRAEKSQEQEQAEARKEVEKFLQLVDDAQEKVRGLADEIGRLRNEQQVQAD